MHEIMQKNHFLILISIDTAKEIRNLIYQMRPEGSSIRAISANLNVPKSTVAEIISKRTIDSKRQGKYGRKKSSINVLNDTILCQPLVN